MIENIKRDIDLKMAQEVKEVKHKLEINEYTKYNISYDIYTNDEEKFLYIKMEENTCSAPFYYNRSYTVNDLHDLHKMFKGFEKFDFEDFLSYFKELFDKGKIKLSFCDPSEERIKMKLDAIYFSKKVPIEFELYREMIPTQKDQKMIELYSLNKNKLIQLKKFKEYLSNYRDATQKEKPKIEEMLKIFDNFKIPGLEKIIKQNPKPVILNEQNPKPVILNEQNPEQEIINANGQKNRRESAPFKKSFICPKLKSKYIINLEKGKLDIILNLKNNYEVDWVMNKYKLVCDEENSNLKFSEIVYPMFDILKGQDGDFIIKFNKDDLKSGNKYICKLFLKVEDQKMDDSDIPLNIKVK